MNGKTGEIVSSVQPAGANASEETIMFRPRTGMFGRSLERNRLPWSADDIDRLCELMARRKPVREIATLLGRTQEAVRTKAYQLDRLSGS